MWHSDVCRSLHARSGACECAQRAKLVCVRSCRAWGTRGTSGRRIYIYIYMFVSLDFSSMVVVISFNINFHWSCISIPHHVNALWSCMLIPVPERVHFISSRLRLSIMLAAFEYRCKGMDTIDSTCSYYLQFLACSILFSSSSVLFFSVACTCSYHCIIHSIFTIMFFKVALWFHFLIMFISCPFDFIS